LFARQGAALPAVARAGRHDHQASSLFADFPQQLASFATFIARVAPR